MAVLPLPPNKRPNALPKLAVVPVLFWGLYVKPTLLPRVEPGLTWINETYEAVEVTLILPVLILPLVPTVVPAT